VPIHRLRIGPGCVPTCWRGADFGNKYGALIKELHLLARAVFVVDRLDKVTYVEYVKEVANPPDFEAALEAVKAHRCELGMIPVENSTAGRVAEVHHLLPESGLRIIGERFKPIHFQLMANPGVKLEDVLDSVPGLTPGDFVRSVKQLIDLLDQIASAAPAPASASASSATAGGASRSLSATARAAIDAMRRGVVAYSAVAD